MYDVLHDFASPIATILAAIAAVGVTVYFNLAQTRIARQQAKLGTVRLKHDLYDHRFELFSAARSLLGHIISKGDVSTDAYTSYARDIGIAPFLVKQEVVDYLERLRTQASRLITLNSLLSDQNLDTEQRKQFAKEKSDIFDWFKDQYQELISKFMPTLGLDESELTPPPP